MENHVHSVLKSSSTGRLSAVGQLLQNRYKFAERTALKDHDYLFTTEGDCSIYHEKKRRIANYKERETHTEGDLHFVGLQASKSDKEKLAKDIASKTKLKQQHLVLDVTGMNA